MAVICWAILSIERWLSILTGIEPETDVKGEVTDPYTKPAEIYSSTEHIIVPKPPSQIRNENFKKFKEGIEYGDIAKR